MGLAELHYPHDVIDVASADALTDAGDDHDDDEDAIVYASMTEADANRAGTRCMVFFEFDGWFAGALVSSRHDALTGTRFVLYPSPLSFSPLKDNDAPSQVPCRLRQRRRRRSRCGP